jgi:hypothetical protein
VAVAAAVALIIVSTAVVVLGPAVPGWWGSAPAEAAARTGSVCRATELGRIRLDPDTGARIQCVEDAGRRAWQPAGTGARSSDLDRTTAADQGADAVSTPVVGSRFQRTTRPPGPRPGDRCTVREGRRTLSPATAELMACTAGRWEPVGRGSQALPPPEVVAPPERAPAAPALPFDACPENGLPPGVSLPAAATVMGGYPEYRETLDRTKRRRCVVAATMAPLTDLEATHAWFVGQCASITWRHDPRGVERLPTDPLPGPSYDTDTVMILGECRTRAGSPTDRRKKTPWYLTWSVAQPPPEVPEGGGAPVPQPVELIVEVRDTSRIGGRPAG